VCRRLLARWSEICLAENIGLTKLYNAMDDGAYTDLKKLHRELDEAVAACYGWPKSIAQHDAEIVKRLTELNREIVEGRRGYHPFACLDGGSTS
jgi:phosphoserine phosphatase